MSYIWLLTTITEPADVGDWPGSERGNRETPPKPLRRMEGYRAAINGLLELLSLACEREARRGERPPDLPATVSRLMTCEALRFQIGLTSSNPSKGAYLTPSLTAALKYISRKCA